METDTHGAVNHNNYSPSKLTL